MIRVNSQSFSLSSTLRKKNLNDNDIRIDHNNISKSQSFPVQTKHQNHQDHRSNSQISNNLHLHYVTQRILASILPRREPAAVNDIQSFDGPHNENQQQDKYEKEVISMLEQKHGKNYRVFDLESCISVITLERICELCKYIDKWLGSGQEKVVVLQDREDRQRLGAAIAAYLEYLDICALNISTTSRNKSQRNSSSGSSQDDLRAQNAITKNWLDLDIFAMKKFLEDFIGPLRIPSHKRYINYFSGLLSGKIKLNSSPLLLKYIAIESPPSWLQYNRMSSDTEWNSFIKIYEGLRCVYTSDIHIIPITTRQFLYQIGNLQLRGDILIRCYQIVSTTNSALQNNSNNNYYTNGDSGNLQLQDKRELIFSLQFHTCAMFSTEVTFKKDDLDYAWCDNRFPNDCRVTFHFNKSGTKNISNENGYVFQSPLIRTEPPNALAKSNSIENFDLSTKYQGPLDGSLYATILKSPKSSQYPAITSPSQQQQQQLIRPASTSVNILTNLISPPPQFSNNNNIHQQQFNTSTPIRQTARHSVEPNRLSSTSTTTITSTSSSTNQQQHQQNSSRPGTLTRSSQSQPRTDYFYVENRPSSETLQSNYRNSSNKNPAGTSGGQQHSTVVETYQNTQNRSSTGQQNYHHHQQSSQQQQQHSQQNGRNSVRSPLTLSMDSGISSSGVLRAQQGSSVSPSSFPSQASPQEDRHRELDDILSDMLMTVQDIPDFNNKVHQSKNKSNTINSKHTTYRQQHNTIRSQSVIPTLPQKTIKIQPATSLYVLPVVAHPTNYANDTTNNRELKRSVSYAAYENSHQPQQTIIINPYLSVKDLYDTASTTTTLTPPPSESGRDTPTQHIIVGGSNQRCLHHQQQYEQRQKQNRFDTLSSMASSTNTLTSQATTTTRCTNRSTSGGICGGSNNNLQQNISPPQSSTNHHQVRTTTTQLSVSEDDDNIPYHAREHSKPFTYGNVPNGHQLSETPIQIGDDELDTSVEIFDPKMIKAQSGLSSPSLVRKFGGSNATITNQSSTQSTLSKTPARNDFEDMLRERREKVMSEKYLISDKPTSVDQNQKWINTTVNQTNGYHYYNEPLKRSNTLDGFQRSNSTDGLSGQTWLQLQQQKLRAKKGQQLRDERKYFEEIHTEIRNRPQRSLTNGRRYDGYASDTAAFGDEVDYRRPLHVQMPYNTSRSPERKYNTITTTTTTTTNNKERPFVAIKRAHEQAKRETVGMREESFSSYRSETDHELSSTGSPRPETPAFPVTPRTPYGLSNGSVSPALPPKSPTSQRRFNNSSWSLRSQKSAVSNLDVSKDLYSGNQKGHVEFVDQIHYTTRRNSNTSTTTSEPQEVAPHHVKFVRDSSKFWYKPTISREEAITLLRHAQPGTFIVRDSTTFKNAFGLVVRVAQLPPGVTAKQGGDELVRHFLVEPTSRGVRLKGCANEPVFTSLSALVYQHSIMPLALPCRLLIPDRDIQSVEIHTPAQKHLLSQGAACNVHYLYACDTESLTGEEAVRRAVSQLYSRKPLPLPTEVHFKVAQQGITLTDNTRQKFFRKHYSNNIVSFCGFDPDRRTWSIKTEGDFPVQNKTIFAFVARRSASSHDNQCHVFCDLAPNQPATAIVSFVNKVLPTEKQVNENI